MIFLCHCSAFLHTYYIATALLNSCGALLLLTHIGGGTWMKGGISRDPHTLDVLSIIDSGFLWHVYWPLLCRVRMRDAWLRGHV
jgi:hypothetical protein